MTERSCVLIAEDDSRDVELVQSSLDELGLPADIVVVRDGAEALEFLHKTGRYDGSGHPDPVLVLLDIKMPKMDGIQVLREIKGSEEFRHIPVVMLTSSRQASDLKECYDSGVNAYVVKPMRFSVFVETIKQLGLFWVTVNEPAP